MKKVTRFLAAFVVELWFLIDELLHRVGLRAHLDSLYALLARRSTGFNRLYGFFLSAVYRKSYSSYNVEKNLIFLDCFWGRKVGGNPYAIYREILKDSSEKWRFVWVKNAGISAPEDVKDNPDVVFVEHRSIDYVKYLLKAGFLVCNSNFLPFFAKRKEQVFINTWHGTPLKTLGLDTPQPLAASLNTQRHFNQASMIPMSSSWTTDKVVASYGARLAMSQVSETGSPRIDLMLNADVDELYKKLRVPAGKKVILYAPTWRGGSIKSVSRDISAQIEAINTIKNATADEYVLYVSLHHLTRKALGVRPSAINYVPDDVDISEFLSVVDVLVSDYSSIFIDFLILDRPIVLHVPDYEDYKIERGLLFDVEELPVVVSYKTIDLIKIFQKLEKPSSFSAFNEFKDRWLPYEDGESASRCWLKSKEYLINNLPNSRKNILLYAGKLANNGITQSLLNLLESVDQERYKFWIVFPAKFGGLSHEGAKNIVEIEKYSEVILIPNQSRMLASEYLSAVLFKHFSSPLFDLFKYRLKSYASYEARRLIGNVKFDFYIDFTGYSYFWSILAPYLNVNTRLTYLHNDMYEEWKSKKEMSGLGAIFKNYKDFDYLVSVSHACQEQNDKKLAKYMSGGSASVSVPNSFNGAKVIKRAKVEVADVSPSTAALLNNKSPGVIFIAISRLSPEKNLSLLLDSFAKVVIEHTSALLLIVGDGRERGELEAKVVDLGLADAVFFTGFLSNPAPLLKASDCLVFPSKYEGQGLVLLEALTLGKYCIATDVPTSREIIKENYGDLVQPSIEAFSQAMLTYCKNFPVSKSFDHESYSRYATKKFDDLLDGRLG